MEADTLNCPMCGASASTEAVHCEHCGARLATISCPSCFGLMFFGEKFCSHCGAQAASTPAPVTTPLLCPRCRIQMEAITVGPTDLRECPRCNGLWVDVASLEQICLNRGRQTAVLGLVTELPAAEPGHIETVRYVPCPLCRNLMNRVQFAHCSHVIVDVCKAHGTWFDRDELRRIVDFIRGGGLDTARARQLDELEERRRRLSQ